MPFHHQRHGFRHLAVVKEFGGQPLATVVPDLFQQADHLREVVGLVQRLKGLQQALELLRKLAAEVVLIVGRSDLNADGYDGDPAVDERPVGLPPADEALDTAGHQPAAGRELLPGDGLVPGDAQALRPAKLQKLILVKIEIVDFEHIEVLLPIGPEIAASTGAGLPPAQAHASIPPVVRLRHKAMLRHGPGILLIQHIAAIHSDTPPPPQSAESIPRSAA